MSQIHRRRFLNGEKTPSELHSELAFPPTATCHVCSRRPAIIARVFMSVADLRRKDPDFDLLCARDPKGVMSTVVQFKGSDGRAEPYVRVTQTYACAQHQKDLELTAAKRVPSWAVVEFSYGPKDTVSAGFGTMPT